MSLRVKLSEVDEESLSEDLHIEIKDNKYNKFQKARYVYPYKIVEEEGEEYIYVPFGYGMNKFKKDYRRERKEFDKSVCKFNAKLRPHQEEIKTEALKFLNKTGCVMISLYTGGGKTITAIKIASMIKLPTVVITKGIAIIEQWKESISRFTDGSCQILKPKTVIKEDQNFYICNAINVEKIAKSGLFNKIGLVIVDEAHQIMSEVLSKSLTCITPRYLVGLTATPYRYDGYDALLGLYFGLLSKNNEKQEDTKDSLIYRKLSVPHTVYKIDTGFKPEIEMNSQGKVDWGKVLDSQCSDIDRNELIVKIVKYFDKRVFLILTKRIYQAEYLLRRLKEEEEDVTSLFGSQKTYRGEARILIGTTQKVGTGFDHPRLDTLLLATDTLNYYIQNLGRVCRSPDSRPIFFDLVDDYSLLKRHFSTRKSVYIEHGGRFRNFDEDYPEFD